MNQNKFDWENSRDCNNNKLESNYRQKMQKQLYIFKANNLRNMHSISSLKIRKNFQQITKNMHKELEK